MGSKEHEVYIMQDTDGDEWVSPTPARDVIIAHVTDETDLEDGDLDDLDSYVDIGDLERVLNDTNDDSLEFTVEGHEVTVTSKGDVEVTS